MYIYRVKMPLPLIIFMLLLLVTIACGTSTTENDISPYVKDIILADQEPHTWYLSPSGDKLLYDTEKSRKQAEVRVLSTGQEIQLDDCFEFLWLNDETIYCIDDERFEITIYEFTSDLSIISTTSVQIITVPQAELDTLSLSQAKTIYRVQTDPDSLLILGLKQDQNTNQYYYVSEPENIDTLLENLTYTTIPVYGHLLQKISEKIYSPNKNYYYHLQDNHLAIYNAIDNRLLVEILKPSHEWFQIGGQYLNQSGGWAADSNCVYFQMFQPSGFGAPPPPPQPIQKLCVPGTPRPVFTPSGCGDMRLTEPAIQFILVSITSLWVS